MKWHLHASVNGWYIRYGDENFNVTFAPNQFGKVVSSSGCGYEWSSKELCDATQVVLNSLRKPHRFGHRFSVAREKFYQAVADELNQFGYVPHRKQLNTSHRPAAPGEAASQSREGT